MSNIPSNHSNKESKEICSNQQSSFNLSQLDFSQMVDDLLEMENKKSEIIGTLDKSQKNGGSINVNLAKALFPFLLDVNGRFVSEGDSKLFIKYVYAAIDSNDNVEEKRAEFYSIFEKYIFDINTGEIGNFTLFSHFFPRFQLDLKEKYFTVHFSNHSGSSFDEKSHYLLQTMNTEFVLNHFTQEDGLLRDFTEDNIDLIVKLYWDVKNSMSMEGTQEVLRLISEYGLDKVLEGGYNVTGEYCHTFGWPETFSDFFIANYKGELDINHVLDVVLKDIDKKTLSALRKRYEDLPEILCERGFFEDDDNVELYCQACDESEVPDKYKLWDYSLQLSLIDGIDDKMCQRILGDYPNVESLQEALDDDEVDYLPQEVISVLLDSDFLYYEI